MVITLIRWFIAFVVISAIIFILRKEFSPAKKQQKAKIVEVEVEVEDKNKGKEKEEKGPWYDFRGGFPYELWGPIIGWILLQPCWWLLQPTFCTRVFQSGYYWAFQGVLLFVLLGLLGKHKGVTIFAFVVRFATWGTLILILIAFLYYGLSENGPKNIGRLNAWFNDVAEQGEIADVENKYDDYVDRQNKERLDKLEERAAKGDLDAVREAKKIKAERARSKAKKKKTVQDKREPAQQQRIEKVFDIPATTIPAGQPRNVKGNIERTGIMFEKGDNIKYNVLTKGSPIQIRNGLTEDRGDRVQIFNSLAMVGSERGEIQFIRWDKPTRVHIELNPVRAKGVCFILCCKSLD